MSTNLLVVLLGSRLRLSSSPHSWWHHRIENGPAGAFSMPDGMRYASSDASARATCCGNCFLSQGRYQPRARIALVEQRGRHADSDDRLCLPILLVYGRVWVMRASRAASCASLRPSLPPAAPPGPAAGRSRQGSPKRREETPTSPAHPGTTAGR